MNNNSTKPIENLTSFTAVLFEPEVIEEWIDPFDSITLKVLTLIVYIIEVSMNTVVEFHGESCEIQKLFTPQ